MRLSRRIMYLQRRLPSWCALSPSNLSLVLVFALAYITVRGYLLKIMRQQRAFVYQLDSPGTHYQEVGRIFSQSKLHPSYRDCPLLALAQASEMNTAGELKESSLYGSCRRVPPVPGSCDVANQIFMSSPPESCSAQRSFNFCQLEGNSDVGWRVVCNEKAAKVCLSNLFVGMMNQTVGRLGWMQFDSLSKVSQMLNKVLHSPTANLKHFGFSFIKCVVDVEKVPVVDFADQGTGEDYYDGNSDADDILEDIYGEQLLILPPHFEKQNGFEKDFRETISVNLVFIDSVSHQHFFRSLNASVAALEKIRASAHPLASVFDFELLQAVKSRTFESLQAIFAGFVDTEAEPFGIQAIPPEPLRLEALLAGFRERKYHTLWLEDLCHTWEWGLAKDLHFLNKDPVPDKEFWDRMWRQLHHAELDDVGPTLAMCKVLAANNVRDHFHGPNAVCFNGRHQHEYLLEYLLLHQQVAQAVHQPTFTFTQTNVGHEDSGRRIQTLDQSLASYIDSASHLPNTLTIILSDHGNAYGSFLKASEEAMRELYHPPMFFIVPKRVAHILGKDIMHALKVNTKRLVSLLDLHRALRHLQRLGDKPAPPISPDRGLFSPINISRTCNDIPRIKPNLCICENFETPVSNDTDYLLMAYFAVGRLNDEIQRQSLTSSVGTTAESAGKMVSNTSVAFGNCERLVLKGADNIKESKEKDGSLTVKMELKVQMAQVFLVSLVMRPQSVQKRVDQAPRLKLQTYERLTSYSQFAPCAEADEVWQSLCICNLKSANLAVKERNTFKDAKHKESYVANEDSEHFKTRRGTFNMTFYIDIDIADFHRDFKKDNESGKKHSSRYLKHNGKILSIPQYKDYINENPLLGFKMSALYSKASSRDTAKKIIQSRGIGECVLFMWMRHPKGVVLSAANTCQALVSVLFVVPVKGTKDSSSLVYTAGSSTSTGDMLVPRGTRLLAVLWDRDGKGSSSESKHLTLEVKLVGFY